MRLFQPIYQWLVLAAAALLIASFLTPDLSADIRFQDRFFVFDLATLLRALALGSFLLWLLYLVNRQYLHSPKLTRIHVMVTLVSIAAVIGMTLWINDLRKSLTPARQDLWQTYYRSEQVLNIAIVILAAAQAVFLMNLMLGLKRKLIK